MAITTTEQTNILNLVMGMFNASPGAANLTEIVSIYEAHGKDLGRLADALAEATVYKAQFSGLVTLDAQAAKMAGNFGLTSGAAYTEAVAFFKAGLATKTTQALMKEAVDYLTGSTVSATYTAVAATLTNKVTVAIDHSVTKQLSPTTFAELQSVVASVDSTAASVTAAIAAASTGTTYTLTTAANALTGTTGDDTFIAGVSATAADNTLTLIDTIDGGAGTDSLNVTANVLAADIAVPASGISNVETINIKAVDGDGTVGVHAATYVAGAGVTSVNSNASNSNVTVTGLAAGASVGMIGNGAAINGILNYAYSTATSAQTINISGGTLNSGVASITATASTGVTTATINSTGATNKVDVIKLDSAGGNTVTSLTVNAATNLTATLTAADFAATAALTITGAGTANLGTTFDGKTIDASTNTGGVTVAATAGVTLAITGGTGNDTITTAATLATGGAVNAGDGTDILVVNAVTDVDTSGETAKYTNFETLQVNGTLNAALFTGITGLRLSGATNAVTGLNAATAANVTATADIGATTLALSTASGSSDVLSLSMGTGLTTSAATSAGALTVTGFETVNIATNHGATATAGANKTSTIASFGTPTNLTAVNLTGSAFVITDAATTKATTFDASALTGSGAATSLGLTVGTTTFKAGSTVTGSAFVDNVTVNAGTEGATFNLGAGNDIINVDVATLVADGTTDGGYNGGTGTDTLNVSDVTLLLTDNHFTNVTGMEKLVIVNTTGDGSITTGTAFNTAYSAGATITTGILAVTKDMTFNGGLSSVDTNITVTATSSVGTATENNVLTTGSGADKVTFTGDDTYVGVNGAAQGTIVISTGAGDDTIAVTVGTLLASTANNAMTITGGTGADTITLTKVNSTTITSVAQIVMAAGDSTTTAHDKITGYDVSNTTLGDVLDFAGTAAVGTLATSTDSGTILTHSITTGVAKFDDASTYAAELVINSANLSDVAGYLAANVQANGVVAFAYDSNSSGAADSTMVFHQGASAGVTDSLVQLTGVTGVTSLNATLTTATANTVLIA